MTGMVVSDPEVEAGCARHHQGVVGEAQVEVGILDGATTVTDPADDHLKDDRALRESASFVINLDTEQLIAKASNLEFK